MLDLKTQVVVFSSVDIDKVDSTLLSAAGDENFSCQFYGMWFAGGPMLTLTHVYFFFYFVMYTIQRPEPVISDASHCQKRETVILQKCRLELRNK